MCSCPQKIRIQLLSALAPPGPGRPELRGVGGRRLRSSMISPTTLMKRSLSSQLSLTALNQLIDYLIQIVCRKGILQNNSDAIHMHSQLSCSTLSHFEQFMLASGILRVITAR